MRAIVVVVAAIAGLPGLARADPDAALQHLDAGVAAYNAGDFARAHVELAAARDLAPTKPNPYRWLALTELQEGACAAAIDDVAAFLARVPAGDPRIGELERLRDQCQRTGQVTLTAHPPEVELRIDDTIAARTPAHLTMRTGNHVVVARRAGFVGETRTILVPPSGELAVAFELAPVATSIAHRWWFWTAIGAVAIGAAAVTYGLARGGADERRFPPITCDAGACR